MDFKVKVVLLIQISSFITCIIHRVNSNDARDYQNHRNGILNLKDVADHWIGFPKSPYTSFTVTANPTTTPTAPPTSAPLSANKITKKRKKKTKSKKTYNKRRNDNDDSPDYREIYKNREKYAYEDDIDYDYDGILGPTYSNSYSPSPYIIRSAATSPKAMVVNPSVGSSSKSLKAIYAGTPKVATYVIPNSKQYVVRRVTGETVYAPRASHSSDLYGSASSSSGMRRLDPSDYDDPAGSSFLNLGPQESFPPRPVMNKITQPGQRQPCHGPECHQHHKGLVRFYWRRVVYPTGSGGRGRARRRRPVRGRNQRRRLRGSARAPSDQKDIYYTEKDNTDEVGDDDSNTYGNSNDEEEEEEDEEGEEEEDTEENDSNRRNVWQPGKAYGHDLNEGNNYDDKDLKVYRDKRYAYKKWMRNRYINK